METILGPDGKPVGMDENRVVDAQGKVTVDLALLAKVEALKEREDVRAVVFGLVTCYQAYAVFRRQLEALQGDTEAKRMLLDQIMRGQLQVEVPLGELGKDLQTTIGPMFVDMHNRSTEIQRKRTKAYAKVDKVIRSRAIPTSFLGTPLTLDRGQVVCVPVELSAGQTLQQAALLLSERFLLDNVRAYTLVYEGGEALKTAPVVARRATILPDYWRGSFSDKAARMWELQYADVLICPEPDSLWLQSEGADWRQDMLNTLGRLRAKGMSVICLGPAAVKLFQDIQGSDGARGDRLRESTVLLPTPLTLRMNARKREGAEESTLAAELVNGEGTLVHDIPMREIPAEEKVALED